MMKTLEFSGQLYSESSELEENGTPLQLWSRFVADQIAFDRKGLRRCHYLPSEKFAKPWEKIILLYNYASCRSTHGNSIHLDLILHGQLADANMGDFGCGDVYEMNSRTIGITLQVYLPKLQIVVPRMSKICQQLHKRVTLRASEVQLLAICM